MAQLHWPYVQSYLAWTPPDSGTPRVKVFPLGVECGPDYLCTGGAAYTERRTSQPQQVLGFIIADIATLLRDGLDGRAVHSAALGWDEYRRLVQKGGG